MKNKIIALALFSSVAFSSCNEDKIDKENSIFNDLEATTNAFDRWLNNNYRNPYNIEVKYRMEDLESSMNFILAPADYDKAVALMKIVKHVWLEAYDEIVGPSFLRKFVPRSMHIIGSEAYNQNGTTVLGTAEGGMKITLYNVNYLNPSSIDINLLNEYYFRTMHHEFAHILHQTRNYDPDFDRITESKYVGDNWYIYTDPITATSQYRTDEMAWADGFVTPYAMSEAREDFVETITTFITNDQAYWDNMLKKAGTESAKIITAKFTIAQTYMLDTWKIDLFQLRQTVLRRQKEVSVLNLKL